MATLEIDGSGVLSYVGADAENNSLTVQCSAGSYGFFDSGATITLGAGAVTAGWTGSGTNTVTGSASTITSVSISPGGGTNVVNLRQVVDPVTVEGGSGATQVNVCSNAPATTGNLSAIGGAVTVNPGANTSLTVADYGGQSRPQTVLIDAGGIYNLAPHPIHFGAGALASLRVVGSNVAGLSESFEVSAPPAVFFRLDTNGGGDTVVVSGDATGDFRLGAGDDVLTVVSGVTLTGDVFMGSGSNVVNHGGPTYGTITGTIS